MGRSLGFWSTLCPLGLVVLIAWVIVEGGGGRLIFEDPAVEVGDSHVAPVSAARGCLVVTMPSSCAVTENEKQLRQRRLLPYIYVRFA